ncbi:MAG: hypothetical protein HQK49_21020 [Oligoflexia bacterium]|nr:hypothetical protein [Oligoflexia bacterium]
MKYFKTNSSELNSKINTISILGVGWLGTNLAQLILKQQNEKVTIKGSTTTPSKVEHLQKMGIKPYLINLHPQGPDLNFDFDFLNTDLLIISLPPKVKTEGVDFHLWQINTLINFIDSQIPIIYLSSTSVYGDNQGAVDESTTPIPTKFSGKVILRAEEILREKFKDKLTILRLGGLIGPGREPSRLSKKNPQLFNSHSKINLIHLDDACGIILAIIYKNAWGEIFNGVADEHFSKLDFYSLYSQPSPSSLSLALPNANKIDDSNCKVVSNLKIKDLLQYQTKSLITNLNL